MGLLDSLFLDPTAAGGGWLANLLGITPANTTKTPTVGVRNQATGAFTPAALVAQTAAQGGPAPVNPAMSAFSPPQGLLGNSLLANGIRGGLAGLASSNGYKGFGAQLGAGFEGGVQGNLARQQIMARNALMGQAYQQGQQQLAMGNIGLAQTVARYNVWANMSGRPTITVAQAQADPNLLAQVMAGSQGGAPASNGSTPQPGMSPVYGGGQSVDPNVAAAYPASAQGGSPQQGQPQQDPEAGFRQTHGGMSTTDWANYGYQLAAAGDPSGMEMVKQATDYNPDVQRQLALAKSQGTLMNSRAGSIPMLNGQPVGRGVPTVQTRVNPTTGNEEKVLVYPTGEVEPLTQGGPSAGGAPGGNNVGNIRAPGGGFRQYPDLASGIQGTISNLQAYGKQGINTVNDIIKTWAPPSENDTQAYIDDVAKQTGFKPDQKLDMTDQRVLTRLTMAIAAHEQGNPAADNSGGNQGLIGKLGPFQEGRFKTWSDQLGEWGKGVRNSYVGEQRATAIADALRATQSGAWATEKASLAAKLKAAGINIPPEILGDPAQVQIALKDNFQSSLEQIKQFSSRPAAAELTLAQQNFANPNLQPEANLAIISQVIGTLRWDRDAYAAAEKKLDKMPGDPDAFAYEWGQKHPLQGYIDKAQASLGPLKGMQKSAAPSVGTVEGGYRFKGGDPSQQANWEKVN